MAREISIYNEAGKQAGTLTLPEAVFAVPWNADLVHQVVVSMESNGRTPIAHTKNRGDVSGGGKKPWRQKGTGRARHGSIRSPLWRGGGTTFGPRNEKDFSRKVNRKMKAKALFAVLSQKLKDNEILFLEDISLAEPKTATAKKLLATLSSVSGFEKLSTKRKNAAFVALGNRNDTAKKSFRNFGNIEIDSVRNLNPLTALKYKYLIVTKPQESVEFLAGKMGK
jgi:large subunit ribosomal protein L4